jgi:2'-hydroxyisoflavone reductase
MIAAASACSSVIPTSWSAFAPKRILVFGGTDFVGPAVVEALLVDGHKVTILNRGATNPKLFPHVEKLRGFRSADPNDQDLPAPLGPTNPIRSPRLT